MKPKQCVQPHHQQVGRSKRDVQDAPINKTAQNNKSWLPGRKGQGGEGLSEGYGGSEGDGTGASGPEDKK